MLENVDVVVGNEYFVDGETHVLTYLLHIYWKNTGKAVNVHP